MSESTGLMIHSVDVVYATALIDLAQEAGQINDITQEVKELGALLIQSPDLARLMENRVLSAGERAQILDRIFKGKVSDLLYRFIQVVNSKDRLGALANILASYGKLYDLRLGVVEVDVFVPKPLDAGHEGEVAQRLGQALNRKVQIRQHIDPELIGGLKMRIGDEIVDGSVIAQLKILREKMIASGREKIAAMAGAA